MYMHLTCTCTCCTCVPGGKVDCTCSWSIASSLAGSEVVIGTGTGTGTEGGSSSSSVWAGTWYVDSSVRALLTLTSWTPAWTVEQDRSWLFCISRGREKERERGRERKKSTFIWFKHLPDVSPSLPLTVYPSLKIWTRLILHHRWSCNGEKSTTRAGGEKSLQTKIWSRR